ncbi:Gfo/Idh/MocA family oxidoreductase, partial [Myxococcota bacterium]|nr:Gfo/Idh/MocA family oxidoreductase [Myxococcota bacterium]
NVNHLDEQYDGETPDILDNAFVIVEYANGVRACLDLCMFAEGSRDEQEILAVGDQGKLACTIPTGELIHATRSRADLSTEIIPPDPRVAHTGLHHGASYLEHLDFLACIREGRRARVGAREGLRSVEIGVAAHRSIEKGRVIEMSELAD